jgi:TolB-like protein/Tfp pilus assembly protein PilF
MDTESPSWMRQFFEELKRRRVLRVVTVYIIVLWPIIQIADILTPAIGVPPTAMRYMLFAFVAGLPVVLILTWLFDLNKGGIVRATAGDSRPGKALIGRSAEITVIGVLVVAIGVLFFLQSNVTPELPPAADSAAVKTIRAIAVLPFVSFSTEREDELFSDGLTEELLNVLSRIKALRVTARTTSFAYKGVNRNVQDIGDELNVDTILEGSVRRNDVQNTIRVTAQLIDTESGTHIWSNTFDREFRDIFKIQDEIAAAVVEQLHLSLAAGESNVIKARDTAAPEAMVAYSMGRSELAKRTLAAFENAERYFQVAITADPGYANAYAELANAYSLHAEYLPSQQNNPQRDEYLSMAQTQVHKALELDTDNGAAWAAQGLIYSADPQKQDDARTSLERAIQLNPSLAMAHMWYGALIEEPLERQRYLARAFELDPRSPVAGLNLANGLVDAGRDGEAMQVFTQIIEADPHYPGAYRLIAHINEFRGRLGEAIRNYEKHYAMQPTGRVAIILAELWVDVGVFERADEWFEVAQRDAPAGEALRIQWLKIGSFVARGDRPAADAMLLPILERQALTAEDYLNRTRAAYFLGEYERTVVAFEKAVELQAEDLSRQNMGSGQSELFEADLAAAFAYRKLGRDADAEPLLASIEATVQNQIDSGLRVEPALWFALAQLTAIRGETNMALFHLQRAVDEGWRQYWRPYVEPSLEVLLEEPAFEPMMNGLATRMNLMQEEIAFAAAFDQGWKVSI